MIFRGAPRARASTPRGGFVDGRREEMASVADLVRSLRVVGALTSTAWRVIVKRGLSSVYG